MKIPEFEAMRVKKETRKRYGKSFRSAKKAIAYCQEKNIGQAMKMLDHYWN